MSEQIEAEAGEEYGKAILMSPGDAPKNTIYQRMVAILAELPAIGKDARNEQQKFMYRSHDDVMNALNPLLARHGVFVVPQVLERQTDRRETRSGGVMYEVNLHVQYTFYAEDGSTVQASAWGEGTDSGDKSTNKAMTMALKNVLAQAFAISTADTIDADEHTPEETIKQFDPETDLLEGAFQGKDAPKKIGESLREMNPSVDWQQLIANVVTEMFGVTDWRKVDKNDLPDFWRRLSNATHKMREVQPLGAMPPIDDDEIKKAVAYAFSGMVVEVPYEEKGEAVLTKEQAAAADADEDDVPFGKAPSDG